MTEEFIRNSILVHGEDKYDYSKTVYVNNLIEVIIICKVHGEFLQTPKTHKRGSGCRECGLITTANKRTMTNEKFIENATLIHGDTYDYSKVDYLSTNQKVIIICRIHGEFLQTPNSHLHNHGCRLCANNYLSNLKCKKMEIFITMSNMIYLGKYDYSKFVYKNCKSISIIICPIHGEFLQSAESHYSGHECKKCSAIKSNARFKKTTEQFIKEANEVHGDLYDYSKVDYLSTNQKVIIICKIHGEFTQRASCHIKGDGCFHCGIIKTSDAKKYNTETFIECAEKKHGKLYDYSRIDYISSDSKIKIICKKHGEFMQTATQHLRGSGCPTCIHKTEAKLFENIVLKYPSLIRQFKKEWCKRIHCLPYDFCIPEYKIIIELDGGQHFIPIKGWNTTPEEQFKNDKYKEECANQNGYSVIRLLQEDVFYDTYDWIQELCNAIEEIKTSEEITNIYLCKNDEYEHY
jgi:very-short-patch-repair endonuclease